VILDLAARGRPTPWQCPDCRHPLRLVADPRAADRYVCVFPSCGRVWVVAEWRASGPVFL
jgi:hypothetical protein